MVERTFNAVHGGGGQQPRTRIGRVQPRKLRQAVERQVQFGGDAARPEVVDAPNEARVQVEWPHQPEGAFDVGVGHHQGSGDGGAVRERDADRPAIRQVDAGHALAVANGGPGSLCGGGEGIAQRAHAAFDEGGTRAGVVQVPVQVGVNGVWRARPHVRAQNRIHAEGGLEQRVLELLLDHVVDVDRANAQ